MNSHKHHNSDATDIFGFWIYILSDCVLFSILFATFAVMRDAVYGGPQLGELTSLPYVFAETMALLASSLTYGMGMLAMYKRKLAPALVWLGLTFALGLGFVGMELNEFINLYHEGHSWESSASLSSFFTLVGTHGLHVSFGLIWMLVMMLQLGFYGMTPVMQRRLTYLGLFWTFLDLVWIFVFTIVYLMGASS